MKANTMIVVLVAACALLGAGAAQAFHDGFDAYTPGTNIVAYPNWTEWWGGATVSTAQSYSPGNSATYPSGTQGFAGAFHNFGSTQTDVIVSAKIWSNLVGSQDDFRYLHIGIDADDNMWNGGFYIYNVGYSSPGWGGRWGYISGTEPGGSGAESAHDTGVAMGGQWTALEWRVSSATGTEMWMNGNLIATDPSLTGFSLVWLFWDPFYYDTYQVSGRAFVDDVDVTAIPEPSSLLALASGLAGVGVLIRQKR